MLEKGKPPLVCFPSFGFAEIHPFVAPITQREDFASAEATADLGGSDKPLKRLERNFKKGFAPDLDCFILPLQLRLKGLQEPLHLQVQDSPT